MTRLSSPLSNKLGKSLTGVLSLSALSLTALLSSSTALANSCKKTDIDFYLERGFTNEQVVMLCTATGGAQQNSGQQNVVAQNQQAQLAKQRSEDQGYLNDAIDANSVVISSNNLIISPRECVAPPSATNQTVCIDTKITIPLAGMSVGKASKGFLFKKPKVNIRGNIKRELVGLSKLTYRGDRNLVLENLKTNINNVDIILRKSAAPVVVARRIAKYGK